MPSENISYDIVFKNFEFKQKVDLDNFNMDLSPKNKTPNKLNSFLTHNMDISIFKNESARVNDAISANSQLDFLPEINKTQGFENTHFPNSNIHNRMPIWNSINQMKSDSNKSDLEHGGNFASKIKEELKL